MKNVDFKSASLDEKRSKLARVLKSKTNLNDMEIIKAVNSLNLDNQYQIKRISEKQFKEDAKSKEVVVSKKKDWTEKIIITASILVQNKRGGIAQIKKSLVGNLNLETPENSYCLLIY